MPSGTELPLRMSYTKICESECEPICVSVLCGIFFSSIFVVYFYFRSGMSDIDVTKMQRTCYRYATADFPDSPQTAQALKEEFDKPETMERFGKTLVALNEEKVNFLRGIHVSGDFSYAVFVSERIMELIE